MVVRVERRRLQIQSVQQVVDCGDGVVLLRGDVEYLQLRPVVVVEEAVLVNHILSYRLHQDVADYLGNRPRLLVGVIAPMANRGELVPVSADEFQAVDQCVARHLVPYDFNLVDEEQVVELIRRRERGNNLRAGRRPFVVVLQRVDVFHRLLAPPDVDHQMLQAEVLSKLAGGVAVDDLPRQEEVVYLVVVFEQFDVFVGEVQWLPSRGAHVHEAGVEGPSGAFYVVYVFALFRIRGRLPLTSHLPCPRSPG